MSEPSILRDAPPGEPEQDSGKADQGGNATPGTPAPSATGCATSASTVDASHSRPGEQPAESPVAQPRAESEPPAASSGHPSRAGVDTPPRSRSKGPVFYVAGFWHRLAAAAVDLAIIVPVSLLLTWIAGMIAGVSLPQSRHRGIDFWLDLLLASDPALLGTLGLMVAIAAIYVLVFQITLARTPGMRVMSLRIIDQYGDAPSVGRAAARTAGYLAAMATLGLGFLWIGFDSEKQGLHDWLSGTYVVKA